MALRDLTQEQRNLAEFISEISERSYRAGWLHGIEHEVWKAMHAHDFGGAPLSLTAEEVQQLHTMAAKCGGWIIFDEVREETFIPMEEWKARQAG